MAKYRFSELVGRMGSNVLARIESDPDVGFYVRAYTLENDVLVLENGPFKTYPEAFAEWSLLSEAVRVEDAYIRWRGENPRHAWALEYHHQSQCRRVVNGIKEGILLSEDEIAHLWQTAGMFESGYQLVTEEDTEEVK